MAVVIDNEYLTYDDVLLAPGASLPSRNSADYAQTKWGMDIQHPIIPANMDSVSGEDLCEVQLDSGGIAILHRFMSISDRLASWSNLGKNERLFISIGVTPSERAGTKLLLDAGVRRFCIDIAHGHAETVASMIRFIKEHESDSIVIAGNVATPDGYRFLADAGADLIKVGVGPGSHCTTRIVTGCGVPQLSAILELAPELKEYCIPIIADGGLKYSGDITKALAAGADFVMSGSFFAGCKEAPGMVIKQNDGSRWKVYRGMASKDAQIGWRGGDEESIVAEGESSLVRYKGRFANVLHQLLGGLSSGMSYVGAESIRNLQRQAVFVRVSPNVLTENIAHGKS
jgi:IMP dehydrogenase